MRILFLSALLLVSTIDLAFAAYFFELSWSFSMGPLLLFGLGFLFLRPNRKDVGPKDGWYLGEAQELTDPNNPKILKHVVIPKETLNLGVFAVGAQGSGKSDSVNLGQLNAIAHYSPGSGWGFFDGKGDIDLFQKLVASGLKPDYFFSSELSGSDSINLMAGEMNDVLERLKQMLISDTSSTTFYSDQQRRVLATVLPIVLNLGVPVNLRDLYVILTVPAAKKEVFKRAKALKLKASDLGFFKKWVDIPPKECVTNISGLLNRLSLFISGPYSDRLNAYAPEINISEIVESGKTLYCHLPFSDFSKDVALAIISMFGVEAKNRQLAGTDGLKVFPLCFDDWSGFFDKSFVTYLARWRSALMTPSFSFQSTAHLNVVSQTFLDALDDTIATKIFMRTQGNKTTKFAQDLMMEFEQPEITQSEAVVRSEAMFMTKQFRIDARTLRELNPGEAFVSTLIQERGKNKNPLWKVRIPRPDVTGWKSVQMPKAKALDPGRGLGFWDKYMGASDDEKIATILAELAQDESLSESDQNLSLDDGISTHVDSAKRPKSKRKKPTKTKKPKKEVSC